MKVILIFYDLILILFIPFYFVSLIIKGKFTPQVFGRFLVGDESVWRLTRGRQAIWIHAVSLGEVSTCKTLIKKLILKFPDRVILITTVTNTGMSLAKSLSKGNVASLYMPFDLSFLIGPFVRKINPEILILLETELWPNLLYYSRKMSIPVLILNARLSDRSFAKYRFFRRFIKNIVAGIHMFCVQSELDASRFFQLGVDKDKIKITGNMKFDAVEELSSEKFPETGTLKKRLGLKEGDFLIVAGSTHKGEEEHVLDIYVRLKNQFGSLRLLIAPRHLERIGEIESLIDKKGIKAKRLSESSEALGGEVLILDTIGELRLIYGLADIVFVGGSLVAVGGHNILEPAFFAKPIVVGPHMHNFREITRVFLSNDALIQAKDVQDLSSRIGELIPDKGRLSKLGKAAKSVLSSMQGATFTNLEIIEKLIK